MKKKLYPFPVKNIQQKPSTRWQILNHFKGMVLSAIFLLFSMLSFSQQSFQNSKIDPAFKFLLAHKADLSTEALNGFPVLYRIEPTMGFLPGKTTPEARYQCVVYTKNPQALKQQNIVVQAVLPQFVTAWVTLEQITTMANMDDVLYIEAPTLDGLHNDVAVGSTGASLLHQSRANNTVYKGKGVIVATFDSGIDWDHLDYRDPVDTTKSRILRIWDQTITAIGLETPPALFNYGVEYTQDQINDELDGTPTGFVRENDTNGHGSHTSGTSAGNGAALPSRRYTAMAPEADIVFIKGGNGSFSTTNQINALTYLQNIATTFGKPVVLNMSIGGQTGAHDGTRSSEVAIDNFTASAAGRVVVISAGNDNGSAIHKQTVLAPNGNGSLSINAPAGSAGTDVFQFTTWANDNGATTVTVTAPDGSTAVAAAGASTGTPVMTGNFTINLNNSIDVANNNRTINVYVTRSAGSPAGLWTITLDNNTSNNVTYDGWLNYISSSYAATAIVNGDNNMLVGSPGTATSAITAASYVGRLQWASTNGSNYSYTGATQQDNISTFSAIGPRRDGYQKPDVAATGQAVISVLSSNTIPTASDVVENGLYQKNQGTSMSAPVVTGCVALLLQAHPDATASQIKGWLRNSANSDDLTNTTGSTPNATWGYGRVDVYKALVASFNCAPVQRKTYQYDNSYTSTTTGTGTSYSTNRYAVRYTPDINGKIGGMYFHTSASNTFTSLNIEVRSSNAGVPGTLLGTYTVPVVPNTMAPSIAKYSWNYIDLSSVNVDIVSGTDFFLVLVPGAGSAWSLRADNTQVDNRSMFSSNNGTTWTAATTDYRIRAVVYGALSTTQNIATANATDVRNINSSNQFVSSNCELIAQLVPNGENVTKVSGEVTAKVWLEAAVPTLGTDPYVSRHYQITPTTNAVTATGKLTMYFTQAEFTAFNNAPGSILKLPTSNVDVAGIANLRVSKYPGTSSNGTGLADTYTGNPIVIDPADSDIVWNQEKLRWEVSVSVTGFSGFFVQTTPYALPLNVAYFTGIHQGGTNQLSWKINCTNTSASFVIERSNDGTNYSSIGSLTTTQSGCATPFNFTDNAPLKGANFYRVKITDNTGKIVYTHTVLLQQDKASNVGMFPTLITKGGAVQVNTVGANGILTIVDAAGRQVYSHNLLSGSQSILLPITANGIYMYQIKNNTTVMAAGKLVVQ